MQTRVKVCGITDEEGLKLADACGADAVGFIFAERSPRRADPGLVSGLVRGLSPFVLRVGVFLDTDRGRIEELVSRCGLDAVQLHGGESPDLCHRLRDNGRRAGLRVIKAFRISGPNSLATLKEYRGAVDAFLLDTHRPGRPGGTGETFDWNLAVRARERGFEPIILAGGLGPNNIQRAVERVRPWAVDVNSGVEVSPGRKDEGRLREFFDRLAGLEVQNGSISRG